MLNPKHIDRVLVAFSYLNYYPGKGKVYNLLSPHAASTWSAPRIRTRFGVRFECDLNDKLSREIYYLGFDRRDCRVLKRLTKRGDVVLDVGANIGYFSLLLARWMRGTGEVHAFEPFARTADRFERNLSLNPGLRRTVSLHGIALSDFTGKIAMSVPDKGNSGCNYLDSNGAETIPVETVDSYARQIGLTRLDLVKIDVEGSEVAVMQGGRETFRRFRPTIMIEVNPGTLQRFGRTADDLFETLRSLGYREMKYATRMGTLKPLIRPPVFGEEPNIFAFPE
jgi:FkbM family methyltransferase